MICAAVLAVICLIVGVVIGAAVTTYSISTTGMISSVNVGVFADLACTQNLTAISWGSVYPGESVSQIAYVKNTGNAPIVLSMATSGWNPPSANGPLTVAWDREGVSLNPSQVVAATITLSVSPSISGITDFSVTIIITGSG